MIRYYAKGDKSIEEIPEAQPGCWVNIYPPFDQTNLKNFANTYGVPLDFLVDSLDPEERARFEKDDGVELIVIKTPVANPSENEADPLYITTPVSIILAKEFVVTISSSENPVIDSLLLGRVRHLDPADRSQFVLKIFERNVYYFLHYLNEINSKRNLFEQELYNSHRNQELVRLLNIEKSLVYFVTSLRSNELLMLKIQRIDFLAISKKEEESDLLQDILVENSQGSEMAHIYTNILSGTMDAFASIISNNLNTVMKRLTSVTIVLMVPTLVASLYGMNLSLPFAGETWAFGFTLLISLVLSVLLILVFLRKRWF